MAEVTTQQEQVVSDGRLVAAPLGDQLRGERVSKIMKARMQPCSVGDEVPGEPAKGIVHGLLVQRAASAANKETVGEKRMPPTDRLIAPKRTHGGGMQRQHSFRAEFCARHAQRACLRIEVGFLQTEGLAHAQASAGDQTDECDVGDRAQWIGCCGRQRRGPAEDQTDLGGRIDVGRKPSMGWPNQPYRRHLDAMVEDGAEARKSSHRLQALRVVQPLIRRARHCRPPERERRRQGPTRSNAIGKARELQHLQSLDAERKAELAPMGEITTGQHQHRGTRRHDHRGQGWASARRLFRST